MINLAALETRIEHEMQQHDVPGFALALIEGTDVAHARGFGVTSVENPCVAVSAQTMFCCGSISKSLTAGMIMCLVHQGMLGLDEPVTTYLPWLRFSNAAYAGGVTLRRLLSHSSGLFGTGGNFGPRDLGSLEFFIRETVPLLRFVAPPGRVYEYCSLGVDLAGCVAEAACGRYFPDLVRECLLDPLDMQHTTYDRTVAMTFDVALPHFATQDGRPCVQHRMFDYAAANPAAQAMASTLDLAHFVIMVLNEGRFRGHEVLPAGSVAEMLKPQIGLRDAKDSGYGLGFFTFRYGGQRWITHGGMLTPYLCELSFLPDLGIGVVFQCNVTNTFEPERIRRLIFDEYLSGHDTAVHPLPEPPLRHTVALSDYAGVFFSPAAGFATLTHGDDHLRMECRGQRVELYPAPNDLFTSRDSSAVIGFVRESRGLPQYFMLDEHAYGRFGSHATVELPVATLERYAARYLFDDGDTATTWIQDGALYLSLSWQSGEYRCVPLSETAFASAVGLVEFRLREGQFVLAWAGAVLTQRHTAM